MRSSEYDVVVVGAGPVGFTLAIDLGRRGVRTLLVEKDGMGRTACFAQAHFAHDTKPGSFARLRIAQATPTHLIATP